MILKMTTDSAAIWKKVKKACRKHKKDNNLAKIERILSNSSEAKQLLAPEMEYHTYFRAIRQLETFGLVNYYLRGAFALTPYGYYAACHPFKFFLKEYRSDIIAIIALAISLFDLIFNAIF